MAAFTADWSCQTTRCSTGLAWQAWFATRRSVCEWRGRPIVVYLLAKPLVVRTSGPFGAMKWPRSLGWLDSVRGADDAGVGNCSAWLAPASGGNRSLASAIRSFAAGAPAGAPSLLLADIQVGHLRSEGAASANHIRQHTCALFTLVRLLTARPRPGGALLLNFGGEWASWSFIRALGQLLQSCGIDPASSMLLHFNLGAMMAVEDAYMQAHWSSLRRWARHHLGSQFARAHSAEPRVRQAYWQHYFFDLLNEQDASAEIQSYARRYRLCDSRADARASLVARLRARAAGPVSTSGEDFLLLGGQPRPDRGLVILELARSGLLQRARWSAGRFAMCGEPAARFGTAGPFEEAEARALLRSRSSAGVPLVRQLCDQLPKVIDVDPTNRGLTDGQLAKHSLWRGTRFALTFETSIPTAELTLRERLLFTTEKPLKPIQALRPFVMLGSTGSLALLRALGFRTGFGGINASYDTVTDSGLRAHAAIDEVARLLESLSGLGQRAVVEDVLHNQAHLVCGGLRRELRKHALHALQTAVGMAAQPRAQQHGRPL